MSVMDVEVRVLSRVPPTTPSHRDGVVRWGCRRAGKPGVRGDSESARAPTKTCHTPDDLVGPGETVRGDDQPVDALIRYRYHGEVNWNSGYNLFSCKAVENFLDRHPDVTTYEFSPFELPFDLAPQQDPIRSWTERTADGRRELRNGLNLIINLKLLIIRTTGIMA